MQKNEQPLFDPDPLAWFVAACAGVSALGSLDQMISSRRSQYPDRHEPNNQQLDSFLTQIRAFEDALNEILSAIRIIRDLFDQADIRIGEQQRTVRPIRFGRQMNGLTNSDLKYLTDQISKIHQNSITINIRTPIFSDIIARHDYPGTDGLLKILKSAPDVLNGIFFNDEHSLAEAEYKIVEIIERTIRASEGMRRSIVQRGGR